MKTRKSTNQTRDHHAHTMPFESRSLIRPLVFIVVLAFALANPAWSQITCGHSDGLGKVWKHRTKDPNDPSKTLEWYCVDGAFFKIEVKCDDKTTCFAKCVFDGGHNQPIPFPGTDGWDKVIWYNWDKVMCGVTWRDTQRRRGETAQQQADRVRQLLLDSGCDMNCYTWTPTESTEGTGSTLSSAAQSEGLLEVYRGGELVDRREVPAGNTDAFFHDYPYLIEDPIMHDDTALGQVADTGTSVVETFEDGIIEDRYSALPGTDPLALSNGSLYFNIVEPGDGLEISTTGMAHPSCLVLEGMDLAPFNVGNGIGFLLEFEGGDSFDVQMYQINSVRVKAVEKKSDGTETEVIRTIPDIDLDDIDRVQIDWVPSPGTLLERIEVEIWTKNGKKIVKKFRSGLTHAAGRTTAYRISGLDITTDPAVMIDSITFDDTHTDYVDGFVGDLTVATVKVVGPCQNYIVGQPGKLIIEARNAFGDLLPLREVEVTATGAAGAFENPYGMISEDGRTVSLTTDESGAVNAIYTPSSGGMVEFQISAEGGEAVQTTSVRILGIGQPDADPIPPSRMDQE